MSNELVVNGERMSFREEERNDPLIDFLHARGMTGTKYGCGIGACGACKVAVQEKEGGEVFPVLSCYARLCSMEGLRVTTVEGVSKAGALHPFQQKCLDTCAFQCGYSTPGMVMACHVLIDRLSRQRVQRRFLDREISAAMGGHVCRCTGYVRYHQAMREVIEDWGKQPGRTPLVLPDPDPKDEVKVAAAPPRVWFRIRKRSRNDTREKLLEGRFESPEVRLALPASMAWDACRGSLKVRLDDLQTGEPARDFNLRRFLFAGIRSIAFEIDQVRPLDPQAPAEALPAGITLPLAVKGGLHIGKARVPLEADLAATTGAGSRLFVRTRRPIVLALAALDLPVDAFARLFGLTLGAELELGLDDIAVTYGPT
ncbi:MAG TPA: 2Fe-2S iron-sulfur cluster-binding protein [Myxococcaceae bacterium]|jgi:aerobic-type carbon monoxide dehydrogenase small subunit (CoxS/CutS family)